MLFSNELPNMSAKPLGQLLQIRLNFSMDEQNASARIVLLFLAIVTDFIWLLGQISISKRNAP